jgi:hypothetical protein
VFAQDFSFNVIGASFPYAYLLSNVITLFKAGENSVWSQVNKKTSGIWNILRELTFLV